MVKRRCVQEEKDTEPLCFSVLAGVDGDRFCTVVIESPTSIPCSPSIHVFDTTDLHVILQQAVDEIQQSTKSDTAVVIYMDAQQCDLVLRHRDTIRVVAAQVDHLRPVLQEEMRMSRQRVICEYTAPSTWDWLDAEKKPNDGTVPCVVGSVLLVRADTDGTSL